MKIYLFSGRVDVRTRYKHFSHTLVINTIIMKNVCTYLAVINKKVLTE